jgi:hypothetical protein
MANDKNSDPYPTGTYVKGDQTRSVTSTADAVQAAFDGFQRVQEDSDVAQPSAAVNDNDPESFQEDHRSLNEEYDFDKVAEHSDDQADVLPDEHFESDAPTSTSATPDGPSGQPVDESDPSRSFS